MEYAFEPHSPFATESKGFVTRQSLSQLFHRYRTIYRWDAIHERVVCPLICSNKINPEKSYRITIPCLGWRTTARNVLTIIDPSSRSPRRSIIARRSTYGFRSNVKRESTFPRFHQFFIRVLRQPTSTRLSLHRRRWNVIFENEQRETIGLPVFHSTLKSCITHFTDLTVSLDSTFHWYSPEGQSRLPALWSERQKILFNACNEVSSLVPYLECSSRYWKKPYDFVNFHEFNYTTKPGNHDETLSFKWIPTLGPLVEYSRHAYSLRALEVRWTANWKKWLAICTVS